MSETKTGESIRVLLVDDSKIAIAVLKKSLAKFPDIEVVGVAGDGAIALEMIPRLDPDVVCTDFHMPNMDGLELTRRLMHDHPLPILVISVSVRDEKSATVFKLLEAGAVDVLPKPWGGLSPQETENLSEELYHKIKVVSGVVVFHKHDDPDAPRREPAISAKTTGPLSQPTKPLSVSGGDVSSSSPKPGWSPRILTIGASTGGPQALLNILSGLDEKIDLPVVCIQHISAGFMRGLVEWLDQNLKLNVSVAVNGQKPEKGKVYFPEEGAHLLFDTKGQFRLSAEPPLRGHRPSVTMTFNSICEYYGSSVLGVLLTGMGDDGAAGLKNIYDAGGHTLVQDQQSSTVFGMPRVAIELGAAREILSLKDMAPRINRLLKQK